jgi:hypothetical protein
MKVTGNNEIMPGVLPEKQTRPNQDPEGDFGTILKEKIEKSPGPESKPTPAMLNPIASVHPLVAPPLSPPDKEAAIGQIGNILDLLDDYRHKLADSRVTLREMDALVDRISGEKDNLSATLSSMEEGEQLRDILNQTLVTASLEVMKFRRGDYV